MEGKIRLDELLFNRRKFQISLPSLTETDQTSPEISLPSLTALPLDLEQVMLDAQAKVKSVADEMADKVKDEEQRPAFIMQLEQWGNRVLSMVSDLLSVPLRVVQDTLTRFIPTAAVAVSVREPVSRDGKASRGCPLSWSDS